MHHEVPLSKLRHSFCQFPNKSLQLASVVADVSNSHKQGLVQFGFFLAQHCVVHFCLF